MKAVERLVFAFVPSLEERDEIFLLVVFYSYCNDFEESGKFVLGVVLSSGNFWLLVIFDGIFVFTSESSPWTQN